MMVCTDRTFGAEDFTQHSCFLSADHVFIEGAEPHRCTCGARWFDIEQTERAKRQDAARVA